MSTRQSTLDTIHDILLQSCNPSHRIWVNSNGRPCITLGKHHPYANSGGWQYLYRYRMMCYLGRKLDPSEHVHHLDGNIHNNNLNNLHLINPSEHGKIHPIVGPGYDYELHEWQSDARSLHP